MLRYTSGPCSVPFWSMRSPSQVRFVFACCQVTALTTVHVTFTMPDSPWRFDTSNPASFRFVPGASHLPITRDACPGRVGRGRIPRLLRLFLCFSQSSLLLYTSHVGSSRYDTASSDIRYFTVYKLLRGATESENRNSRCVPLRKMNIRNRITLAHSKRQRTAFYKKS
jgi:hypothetical protein